MSDARSDGSAGLPGLWAQALRGVARELARELTLAMREQAPLEKRSVEQPEAEQYLSVLEVCERFQISRATFDRMLRDPGSRLAEIVVRVPPMTGRVKVPLGAFEAWLRERGRPRRKGSG